MVIIRFEYFDLQLDFMNICGEVTMHKGQFKLFLFFWFYVLKQCSSKLNMFCKCIFRRHIVRWWY